MRPTPQYSVLVPVHNEEGDVEELARRIGEQLRDSYEIIFIDDGSTDETWAILERLHVPDRVRIIRFRRNFGKAAALMAAFAASRGEVVFTMDGDLQDDPAEIPKFVAKLDEGFDLVSGWKATRHDPPSKVLPSRLFNFVVRRTTGVELHDMNCGFKCYRGELARRIRIYGELHRFIPALAAAEGYRIGEVKVLHHARQHGRSKYGFSRLFKGFFDLVTVLLATRFRERPAHAFGFASLFSFGGAGLLALAEALVEGPFDLTPWALFLGLSGVVCLAAGWTAEVASCADLQARPEASYSIEERRD